MGSVLDAVERRVTPNMNNALLQRYTPDEVRRALFQMHPSKSPSPNGMSPFFFQKYWNIVGFDVIEAILSILNFGHMLRKINYVHIVLIPKKNDPKQTSDYKPISLGNVVSIILYKVLANRLKTILPTIISEAQSTFVPNQLITDNTTVAYELLHRMWNKRNGKVGQMVVKLDIRKAYNRVEWGFLRNIMIKLGLDHRWVNMAMETITTASYSVTINREPKGFISHSRGIKQGDPFSPYLFLLCAKGLLALLRKAEENRSQGSFASKHGVRISHLLFPDDSLLFCQATVDECRRLLELFGKYEGASRQAINRQKTSLFFSKNTRQEVRNEIQQLLGARVMTECEKYLGLPMPNGKSKVGTFKELHGRITKRVMGWKEKFISKAGHEILIKMVAQAIPTYSMSLFKLPKSICDNINSLLARYWWGQTGAERKIHWISWNKLCTSKKR